MGRFRLERDKLGREQHGPKRFEGGIALFDRQRYNLQRCNLQRCNLQRCNLQRCNLQRCNLQRCNLQWRHVDGFGYRSVDGDGFDGDGFDGDGFDGDRHHCWENHLWVERCRKQFYYRNRDGNVRFGVIEGGREFDGRRYDRPANERNDDCIGAGCRR
ncbi:pentapeptide repeat-containing protein [Halalkaliarchaeum sp. AArc-GB]|uniref:pentapeptide repeat-containing protein n=1 Tax=Halalkaliarchaeum sp. AArc-GB TaxID=3074078 RepID=UPI0028661D2C|nr:pentapeptide repeat-containing protein [Halalkaliarchaeum sp. AArc-GB]MDR5671966.1 pentapeptide repeat-containing protein [Halalkaliarchaeum sp. AArc-GB]